VIDKKQIAAFLEKTAPKVHCLTNPVSMQDMANILLAAGGSAIMAQDLEEVEEITSLCQATLLNTGVPDKEKFMACRLAGKRANALGHPVILDPVGVGASQFRRREINALLQQIKPSIIRCNQGEALTLLSMQMPSKEKDFSVCAVQGKNFGGVESAVELSDKEKLQLADKLSKEYHCTILISGASDAVSDGNNSVLIAGGDVRMARLTGSGCMLSALCALFAGTSISAYEAAVTAVHVWKESSKRAGKRTDIENGGMGSFHFYLFDALDKICHNCEG